MKFIPAPLARTLAAQAFKVQENSPTLLFAGGVVGVIGTVILASRATLKLEDVLEETNTKLEEVKQLENKNFALRDSKYTAKDATHDRTILYVDSVVKITKLYGPAILLGAASIAMLTSSHRILSRRNAGLTAAYVAIEKSFDQYRERVRAELGEEKDKEFYHGTQIITTEDEKGKVTETKVLGDGKLSQYAVIYDEMNPNWRGLPEIDRVFLDAQQRYANERLRREGTLLLNDVYEALGFPRTSAGCVVGWKWNGEGDNFVDFGYGNWPTTEDYIHAREVGVVLDFNVDGLVYNKIDEPDYRKK